MFCLLRTFFSFTTRFGQSLVWGRVSRLFFCKRIMAFEFGLCDCINEVCLQLYVNKIYDLVNCFAYGIRFCLHIVQTPPKPLRPLSLSYLFIGWTLEDSARWGIPRHLQRCAGANPSKGHFLSSLFSVFVGGPFFPKVGRCAQLTLGAIDINCLFHP